jgi:hypothetical protein
MNIKYCCNYCDYKATTIHYIKHVKDNHVKELYNPKTEYMIKGAISSGRTSFYFDVRTEGSNESKQIYVCFPCNKFWARKELATQHYNSCSCKTQQKQFIKSLLRNDTTISETTNGDSEKDKLIMELTRKLEKEQRTDKDKLIMELRKKLNEKQDEDNLDNERAHACGRLMDFCAEELNEDERAIMNEKLKEWDCNIEWDDYIS